MKKLTTSQLILLSFAAAILVGSLLLWLPVSSRDGTSVSYVDALFTATTSVCVTGLVTVVTATEWSTFGQIVILLLIQVGGLGVITIATRLMILFTPKIKLSDRLLLQDAFNLNTLSGMAQFVKKVVLGTLVVEGAGALLYMLVFVPEYGLKGIWYSVFNSVSAFCNAGLDIIKPNSLCDYATNPIINIVTCLLIVVGGIGYIVWWDVIRVIKLRKSRKIKMWQSLTLHSKIAISVTLALIFGGGALIMAFEYSNPETIGQMSFGQKLMASLFQSVTCRTAGFATVPQEALGNGSAIVSLLLMFIGGSPAGTAGGIKTVTVAVLVLSAISVVKDKQSVEVFSRRLSPEAVRKSAAVCTVSFTIVLLSSLALSAVENVPALDIFFETVSATATVGLSRNLTPFLSVAGKIIITLTMFFGRVGPISLAFALSGKQKGVNTVKNPIEEISVG